MKEKFNKMLQTLAKDIAQLRPGFDAQMRLWLDIRELMEKHGIEYMPILPIAPIKVEPPSDWPPKTKEEYLAKLAEGMRNAAIIVPEPQPVKERPRLHVSVAGVEWDAKTDAERYAYVIGKMIRRCGIKVYKCAVMQCGYAKAMTPVKGEDIPRNGHNMHPIDFNGWFVFTGMPQCDKVRYLRRVINVLKLDDWIKVWVDDNDAPEHVQPELPFATRKRLHVVIEGREQTCRTDGQRMASAIEFLFRAYGRETVMQRTNDIRMLHVETGKEGNSLWSRIGTSDWFVMSNMNTGYKVELLNRIISRFKGAKDFVHVYAE